MRLMAILIALLLVACAPKEGLMETGSVVKTPAQWVDFCKRNPQDPGCKE